MHRLIQLAGDRRLRAQLETQATHAQ